MPSEPAPPAVRAAPPDAPPGGVGREALLTALLVLSGAAALLHETVWFRALAPALGVGALTSAAVSAGTLLGLSLGAWAGGRAAEASRRPWALLGLLEASAALLSGGVLLVAGPLAVLADAAPGPAAAGEGAVPALLATLLLALGAAPLGATLPVALRLREASAAGAGAAARRLYGWNTVGAVGGVLLGAGWLLERLGNRGTLGAAAGLQGLVALTAWSVALRRGRPSGATAASRPAAGEAAVGPGAAAGRGAVAAAAFLGGAAGLAVQVAWVRRLTPAVGTTTQSFATVLAAYLLALALASLLLGPRRGQGGARVAAGWLALSALPVALLPAAIAPVARAAAERARAFAGDELDLLALRAGAAGLLLVPSVLFSAAALPWLLRAAVAAGPAGARAAGRLLAWNTAGSAGAALVTGLLWLPAVGSAAVLRGAAGLSLLAAAVLLPARARAVLALLGLGLLAQPFVRPVGDAAGRDAVGASFLPDEFDLEDAPALFFAEGRATTVVVRDRDGRRELWVEGKIEASSQPTDRLHLTLLGSLPLALHPDPRRVGLIGLGTGRTAQAAAAFGPERLVVLELEPEAVRAAALFEGEGAGLPAGAVVVPGDARRSLRGLAERFDVLTSDPIHPGVAGCAALYSLEAYATVRARLAPGGLFCQWLPLYQLSTDDVRLALRGFQRAFPGTHVFQAGLDLILVGAEAPIRVDEARLRARLRGPAGAPLAPLGLRLPGRLLSLHLRNPRSTAIFAGSGPASTDDRLLLEFRAGRAWFVHEEGATAARLAIGRARADELLTAPPSEAFQAEVEASKPYHEGIRAWIGADTERAVEAFGALAAADPQDRFARSMRDEGWVVRAYELADLGRAAEALEALRRLVADAEADDALRLKAAEALAGLGDPEPARAAAREILARRESPRARRLLGR